MKPVILCILTAVFLLECSSSVQKISKESVHSAILRETGKKFECKITDNIVIDNLISLRNRFSSGWKSTWHTLPAAEKEFLFYDRENNLSGQFGFMPGTAVIYEGWLLRSLDKKEEKLLRNEFEKSRKFCTENFLLTP
ncbi:MAG TPA: hypothetical protein PKA14_15955 [Leptospiraceae bacterium]|nr:hypothetical protein [Leptospiraceae bacterium]